MKKILPAAIFFSLVLFGQPGQAADKLRVLDRGIDGNQRTYLVTCPDGTLNTITQTFDIPTAPAKKPPPPPDQTYVGGGVRGGSPQVTRVCITQRHGKDICRPSWGVDDAARASCH